MRFGRGRWRVLVGWPGAAEDRLLAHALLTKPCRPGGPRESGQGCGVAGAPARECGAAPARWPSAVRASRPRLVSCAGAADTARPLGRDLSRDTGDAAGLASQADREEI